ncbi:MAG: pilin [Candidatus Paceibacterota bacterium]|jgi:type IV secretory pathway VirB2 component (pilin)
MKKILFYILILTTLTFSVSSNIFAATVCQEGTVPSPDGNSCVPAPTPVSPTTYQLLSPLPCPDGAAGCSGTKLESFDTALDKNAGLAPYLNTMIKIFIGICAVLAVVMIVIGGLEYMTSELPSNKEGGKNRITQAVFGLILALVAWLILYTINPALLDADLKNVGTATVTVTLDEKIKIYSGGGTCEPITTGLCSPENLAGAGFANGTQASSICKGESNGNASLQSEVDKCKDGNSFSFGLFQVNVIAHANEIPGGVCSGIFEVSGGGTQGACMPGKSKNGICFERDCSVKNPTKYQSCINYINNPANNIAYAKNLQAARGWGQWGANASCHF